MTDQELKISHACLPAGRDFTDLKNISIWDICENLCNLWLVFLHF